jgi:hypothetical protein
MKLIENTFNQKFIFDVADKKSKLGMRAEMEFIFDHLDDFEAEEIRNEINKCFEVLRRHFQSKEKK